ncbi:hypothetical protein [Mycobacterium ahvazicum]|uniref:hypothetical protein n=1 Tax=Mycobacterium ahvazicum TaxID=1964395 RepID=UPI000BB963C4|nr:hypothetical protein [Mycobacterium ahvazicum]
MPDDLLRHAFGPQPYSAWWLVWSVLLVLGVTAWYACLFVWTLPSHRLRRIPIVRRVHSRIIRNRFARGVQRVAAEYDAGRTSAAQACAAIGRTVRSFLHQATGERAQYLHIDAVADGGLAAAAPLLARLGDGQFNAETRVDVGEVSASAQELIRSWT